MDYVGIILDTAKVIGLVLDAPILVPFISIPARFSRKIKTQEDLERTVSEESLKIGLRPPPVAISDYETRSIAFDNGRRRGIILGGDLANRATVREELRNIYERRYLITS